MKEKTVKTKNKRKINFAGPSVEDLGFILNKNKREKEQAANTQIGHTENASTQNSIRTNSHTERGNTQAVRPGQAKETSRRSLHQDVIRDYLNRALGDQQVVVIKISEMQQALNMNNNTLFRRLKKLRNTEFVFKRLIYGTELRRVEKGNGGEPPTR